MSTQFTVPKKGGGGPLLADAEEKDIQYWLGRKIKDLPSSEYPDRDQAWIDAAKAELAARGIDTGDLSAPPAQERRAPAATASPRPAQAAPRQSAALARTSETTLAAMHDASAINAKLEEFSSSCHLVTPATSCAAIPDGFSVSFSIIKVDPSTERGGSGDVAPVGGGKLSLSGNVLKKIGAAAGITWIMEQTGRLDDGSDPNYCHFRAVGLVTNFDGSKRVVSGEVELDLRDGSPQIEAMRARAKDGAAIDSQIRDTRLFLLRHAETKAKLRAIADMGIKRSYTAQELSKPFVVARLMWTGQSDDPELRRMYAEKMADAQMAGVMGLYGNAAALPRRAPAPQRPQLTHAGQFAGHMPPPVGALTSGDLEDDNIPY